MSAHDIIMAAAGGSAAATYIEDVFSTYLTSGTGSAQTVVNGIDLSTKGGLIWEKLRGPGTQSNSLTDTVRGLNTQLNTDSTGTGTTSTSCITAFNTNGFSFGTAYSNSGDTNVFWTFRKQPKFFDVVTWSGDATAGRQIAHSLGSVPGCIIVKNLTNTRNWNIYHRAAAKSGYTPEQSVTYFTTSATTNDTVWNNTAPTSTYFTVGTDLGVNASGSDYVAYIFAHDAGGFGLTGTDNVISCGSYTGTGTAGLTVSLGYEPQWVMIKKTNGADYWYISDNMRNMANSGTTTGAALLANDSMAEYTSNDNVFATANGFGLGNTNGGLNASGGTYIYIAIRRGPMKVPTDATKVLTPSLGLNASANGKAWEAGFPVDMYIRNDKGAGGSFYTSDRLRGSINYLSTNSTATESTVAYSDKLDNNTGVYTTNAYNYTSWIGWMFRRAPSFFDEVCYTGDAVVGRNVNHNLGAVPELIIVKGRSIARGWFVYSQTLGASSGLKLESTAAASASYARWNGTTPTSTVFTLGGDFDENYTGYTYVAYLFATCAGVSKVGSYTGTGSTQTISCGFTGGARFVMIKRTDSTGDWYVWDTARGMVAGTDPYLLLDSTAAEVNANYIYTTSGGFQIVTTAADINASGGSYIYLAIA
jgi:hypothetical protein